MKLKSVTFDRFVPIGDGSKTFRSDKFDIDWSNGARAVIMTDRESGRQFFVDQTGATGEMEPDDGRDQPGPAGSAAPIKKPRR